MCYILPIILPRQIFSSHPRMHSALACVDRIASSLLRRPETWWRQGGIKVFSSVCEGRRAVLSALSAVMASNPSPTLELKLFTDPKYQFYRNTTYPRLIIRQFESLNEVSTFL